MEHCLRTRAQYNAFGKALEEYIKGAKECASKLDDDEIRQELAHSPFLSKVDIKILTEELESREEEETVDYDDLQDESICEMVKCMLKNNVNALID